MGDFFELSEGGGIKAKCQSGYTHIDSIWQSRY